MRARVAAIEKELKELGIVSALVMRESPSHDRPSTLFRERGAYLSPGERVFAATPAVLPPMSDAEMPNRLGLARWLVSPSNPLTARVTVNRAWEQFFGRGIVETSEDFGTQGAPPSHPELLDWLATEFIHLKWSQKALHRLIVTSATYRQDAHVSPALAEKDPYNRLLARGPRFRMEAEMIRDAVLSASGLLSRRRSEGQASSRRNPMASGTILTAMRSGSSAKARTGIAAGSTPSSAGRRPIRAS